MQHTHIFYEYYLGKIYNYWQGKQVTLNLGQNLEPASVFTLGDCKCEKLQPENDTSETALKSLFKWKLKEVLDFVWVICLLCQ